MTAAASTAGWSPVGGCGSGCSWAAGTRDRGHHLRQGVQGGDGDVRRASDGTSRYAAVIGAWGADRGSGEDRRIRAGCSRRPTRWACLMPAGRSVCPRRLCRRACGPVRQQQSWHWWARPFSSRPQARGRGRERGAPPAARHPTAGRSVGTGSCTVGTTPPGGHRRWRHQSASTAGPCGRTQGGGRRDRVGPVCVPQRRVAGDPAVSRTRQGTRPGHQGRG